MLRSLALALVILPVVAQNVGAQSTYAGYRPESDKRGARGYISMQTTVSHFHVNSSWRGVCGNDCAAHVPVDGGTPNREWVQQGLIQGANWAGSGSSASQVRMYYENMSPCNEYFAISDASPSSQPYFFLIRYTNTGLEQHHCASGLPYWGYEFLYKRGSSSTPFFYGVMLTPDGRTDFNTEVHDDEILGVNYFGCSAIGTCNNSAYGLEVFSGSSWNLCCGTPEAIGPTVAGEPGSRNPYRHTYHLAWSFKTCGTSAC